jgi:hypothetical protein
LPQLGEGGRYFPFRSKVRKGVCASFKDITLILTTVTNNIRGPLNECEVLHLTKGIMPAKPSQVFKNTEGPRAWDANQEMHARIQKGIVRTTYSEKQEQAQLPEYGHGTHESMFSHKTVITQKLVGVKVQ